MDSSASPASFVCDWAEYLKQHGHAVKRVPAGSHAIRSRNTRHRRYRWIILLARGSASRLTAIERERLQRQLQLARRHHKKLYLVVKFEHPTQRLIVLPAEAALKAGRIRSDKGGILMGRVGDCIAYSSRFGQVLDRGA